MRPRINIAVETWDPPQTVSYAGVTEARIDRRGALRILDGFRQRAYHPPGEWRAYGVAVADLKLPERGADGPEPVRPSPTEGVN